MLVNCDEESNRVPGLWHHHERDINIFILRHKLDQNQAKAFRHAFENEISLIQGPPGTGKTFVGDKIVQFMLSHLRGRRSTDALSTGPILLTCYTNHALDQFLELIMGSTTNIVRLGGRTKNEDLK